jgi:hypothetical protein
MISMIDSPTELTTAFTDLLLAALSLTVLICVYRTGHYRDSKKTLIWLWAFAFLTAASVLGTAAHGIKMSERTHMILWQPINLSLGMTVALFVSGVVYDLRRLSIPLPFLVLLIASALVFYAITVLIPGSFLIFIIYEAVAMVFAFVSYLVLSIRDKNRGYFFMTAGIFISIIAAMIQATHSVRFRFIWEFDHNGTFHLVQMAGMVFLLFGLRSGFISDYAQKMCQPPRGSAG